MGKGTITKKRGPSIHSRAARRATSPGIDTDKSLKDIRPPTESVDLRPSVLAIHQNSGVSKKTKRNRNLSSKARQRNERGQDRAVAIMERTEKKIAKSKGSARNIQSRRKGWDDINEEALTKSTNPFAGLDDAGQGQDDASELDDEMDEVPQQVGGEKEQQPVADAASVPLPVMDNDDEGIL